MVSPIYRLPIELCFIIANDECLTRRDLGALRLACRVFTDPVASILFHRVKISRLAKDRDSLAGIASTPHIAAHVRELIWYELNLEDWESQLNWDNIVDEQRFSEITAEHPDDFDDMSSLLIKATADPAVFWIPRCQLPSYLDVAPDSVSWFFSTIEKFPNLSSFLSCPMPGMRSFEYHGYTICLDLMRAYTTRCNEGFFTYLLRALGRSTLNIRALHWADEGMGLPYMRLSTQLQGFNDPFVFTSLITIDLCLSGVLEERAHGPKVENPATLTRCLANAQNLESLTLCFERVSDLRKPHILVGHIAKQCSWPRLTYLELVCASLDKCNIFRLFGSCAPRLRKLVLRDCCVSFRDIVHMKSANSFEFLESITITETNRSRNFSEKSLLDFLKDRTDACVDADGTPGPKEPRGRILTVESVYDHRCWPSAAYFDSRVYPEIYHETDLTAMDVDFQSDVRSETDYSIDSDSDDDAPGMIWEFEHHNGEVAQGTDPWEYFSDWDSEAGDVATLVPKPKNPPLLPPGESSQSIPNRPVLVQSSDLIDSSSPSATQS
ncbi:hypothetical protein F5Y16DRAFT_158573 [Xylariaceae sp. FL0255]|nr:hypothetical protein F5Y16DRAFT_158573 [Xylariaceae sp. FL0255]